MLFFTVVLIIVFYLQIDVLKTIV